MNSNFFQEFVRAWRMARMARMVGMANMTGMIRRFASRATRGGCPGHCPGGATGIGANA
jgi:hypothetical protein